MYSDTLGKYFKFYYPCCFTVCELYSEVDVKVSSDVAKVIIFLYFQN